MTAGKTNIADALVLALKVSGGSVGVTRQVCAKAPEQTEISRTVADTNGRQKPEIFRGWTVQHLVEVVTDVAALAGEGEAFLIMAPRSVVKSDALLGAGEESQVHHERANHEASAALASLAVHGDDVLGAVR